MPLLAHVEGDVVAAPPTLIQGRVGASLTEGQLCGIRSPTGRMSKYIFGNGTEELYDLVNDPGELHNLVGEEPALVA